MLEVPIYKTKAGMKHGEEMFVFEGDKTCYRTARPNRLSHPHPTLSPKGTLVRPTMTMVRHLLRTWSCQRRSAKGKGGK